MAITYKPKRGQVLICDFQEAKSRRNSQVLQRPGGPESGQKRDLRGFVPPEMIKKRPVVVLANRSKYLCVLVPLSNSEPNPVCRWHHQLPDLKIPGWSETISWAKCDLIYTVCWDRLFPLKLKGTPRNYIQIFLERSDFEAIHKCVLEAIAI
jgi:uncharacterized protein YifN (PemK superfamily)